MQIVDEQSDQKDFVETFKPLSTLYKYLQYRSETSPLFLPRTLKYRRELTRQKLTRDSTSTKKHNRKMKLFFEGGVVRSKDNQKLPQTLQLTSSILMFRETRILVYQSSRQDPSSYRLKKTCWFSNEEDSTYAIPLSDTTVSCDMHIVLVFQFFAQAWTVVTQDDDDETLAESDLLFHNAQKLNAVNDNSTCDRMGRLTLNLKRIDKSITKRVVVKDNQGIAISTISVDVQAIREDNGMESHELYPTMMKRLPKKKAISETKVFLQYLYDNLMRRFVEPVVQMRCPMCDMFASNPDGLVTHLVCSHSRFRFQVHMSANGDINIFTMVVPGVNRPRPDAFRIKPSDTNYTFIAMDSIKEVEPEPSDVTVVNDGLPRQYFHSMTQIPLRKCELAYDSDDEVDETWFISKSDRLIDEFTDVDPEEKDFFKMWNTLARNEKLKADLDIPTACEKFAKSFGTRLQDPKMRRNAALHMFNLWDYGLLNSRMVADCMRDLDRVSDPMDIASTP